MATPLLLNSEAAPQRGHLAQAIAVLLVTAAVALAINMKIVFSFFRLSNGIRGEGEFPFHFSLNP